MRGVKLFYYLHVELFFLTKFRVNRCGSFTTKTPKFQTIYEEKYEEKKAYSLMIGRPQFLTEGPNANKNVKFKRTR